MQKHFLKQNRSMFNM